MPPPLPPEEVTKLMRFIAAKTKNVTSPMNMSELCRQFKEETGSSVAVTTLIGRIDTYRFKIHGMTEFDTETKVKMLFALSTPIDEGFLEELRRVADVKVDDQQRIIQYKQKDGGLEISEVPIKTGEQKNKEIIQLLAEKSKTTNKPIPDRVLMREFKENNGYTDSIETLSNRYQRVKNTFYQLSKIDKNTKIKMMFISNVKLSGEVLKELQKDADVEVDEEGRIMKYKSSDGSLELEGSHENSSRSYYTDHWNTICAKITDVVSEKDDEEDANYQNDYARERIDLVRFLIERTKNATFPLNISQLAKDYKTEFNCSESQHCVSVRIRTFRQHIHEMNKFDIQTKVKLDFALSAVIDAEFLKELQKDAIVELDKKLRIKKYNANTGSLELEGDHSVSAKTKAARAEIKKRESTRSNQIPTSLSARRNYRFQKSRISLKSNSKKRQLPEKNSGTAQIRNHARMSRGKKRARISYSSSETSEEEIPEEGDDEESGKSEDDITIDSETNNIDNGGDDFDQLSYHYYNERDDAEDLDHIPVPESLIEVKAEVPEEATGGENSLIEPKLEESLIEVKIETPEEPPTSSSEYHYEDNLDHILIEPKPEFS